MSTTEDLKRIEYSYRGHDFVLASDPVYGLWSVSLKKGTKTPEDIAGKYTGVEEAKFGIHAYVNSVEHNKKTV